VGVMNKEHDATKRTRLKHAICRAMGEEKYANTGTWGGVKKKPLRIEIIKSRKISGGGRKGVIGHLEARFHRSELNPIEGRVKTEVGRKKGTLPPGSGQEKREEVLPMLRSAQTNHGNEGKSAGTAPLKSQSQSKMVGKDPGGEKGGKTNRGRSRLGDPTVRQGSIVIPTIHGETLGFSPKRLNQSKRRRRGI